MPLHMIFGIDGGVMIITALVSIAGALITYFKWIYSPEAQPECKKTGCFGLEVRPAIASSDPLWKCVHCGTVFESKEELKKKGQ